jgi:hypothetical protein
VSSPSYGSQQWADVVVAGLTFYLNGYTGPRISDLELKRLIAIHGGNVRYVPQTSCSYHADTIFVASWQTRRVRTS